MNEESSIVIEPNKEDSKTQQTKPNQVLIWTVLSLAVASIGISSFALWTAHKISAKLNDLSFGATYSSYEQSNDLLTPDIGVIQFLHKGYSITFDSLSYTPSGLELTGTIGNPHQITLSSLNLKISARRPLYNLKDKIVQDPFFIYSDEIDIGSGQTTVPILLPGTTSKFLMTIPNVKQTSDGLQLVVSFSGERYAY